MIAFTCSGTHREIGRATGETLRDGVAHNLSTLEDSRGGEATVRRRIVAFAETTERYMPEVAEEMLGIAEGANQNLEDIYRLNFPSANVDLDLDYGIGCTNVGFLESDGGLLGKNNDMGEPLSDAAALAHALRIATPPSGIPTATLSFSGMISTLDGMNAEGLAIGHSSVGSRYQQSDRHPAIRPWGYLGLLRCRTTEELVRHMSSVPLRGKGYAVLCLDDSGDMCSIEAACPFVQVRKPDLEAGMQVVNIYQLPALKDGDRRSPGGRTNSGARREYLRGVLQEVGDFDVTTMQRVLRHHGSPSICRHGGIDGSFTTFSMIAVPRERRIYYLDGPPCESGYDSLQL